MPSIRFLASLPDEDGLHAALEKMEAADAASITILRKRSQCEPLRNIISGLWFAVLYRAVERHTSCIKATRKDSRCRAIRNLTACLRAGNEISGHNNNISKTVSKRMRSGLASWSTLSQEPSLLAIINFSNPPSKEDLHDLSSILEHNDLRHSTNCYRALIQRILRFIDKTLRRTEILYRYLESALQDVIDLVNCETHPREGDVEDASTNLLSQHSRSQDELTGTYPFGFNPSYTHYSVSLEAAFNKSTHPRYTVYVRALFEQGMASIYDVDPYNLGLLYYVSYYCWRCYGVTKAVQMCRMLVQMGADLNMTDEIGK
ncbi:hypothetical protein DL95DRAFT_398363 [Leptodontidium sp. 2 PMI_412]|nr:hypothetical protein DL95DRAFT_398363 [Leptodontidium sp. 2 PMI_412]